MKTDREIVSVTSVPESPYAERQRRMRNYATAMTIRTVCVILMVILPSPWFWVAALGAIFLPYFAVVLANNQSLDTSLAQPEVVGSRELSRST